MLEAHEALLNGSGKFAYFEGRGLSKETVEAAYVGYENGAFSYPCLSRRGDLLGVHYKSEARDERGKRRQRWKGHADDLPPKGHGNKPNDPAKVIVFGMETLRDLKPESQVILTCGEEDALSLRQAGYTALSQPGAGLLEPVYARELAGLKVVLFYDAGEEQDACKDAAKLEEAGAEEVRVVEWPENAPSGADINGRLVDDPSGFEEWAAGMIDAARPLPHTPRVKDRPGQPDRYGGGSVYTNTPFTPIPRRSLPEATEFPVDALPKACRQLVKEAAAAIGCPADFIALPMLVTLGSAIGNSRVLKLKRGWEEGATLYAAVVAAPGEKKSPAQKVAVEPAIKKQAALREKYRKELDEYERDMREWDVEKKEAARNAQPAPPPPKEPVMKRTVIEDTTVEALSVVLKDTPRGVVSVRDELSGWVGAMNQYKAGGKGADRQFWLSAWSNSYVSVERKSRSEPLILPRPFVEVLGTIQPAILPELSAGREDGLLDRFLFSYPVPGHSRFTDDEISLEAQSAYKSIYDSLSKLHMPEDDYGDPDPKRVMLAPDAKEVFKEVVNRHREEMEFPGFPPRLAGPWSKLEAYLARLCLILAMARAVEDEAPERVEARDVLMAMFLLDYFKNHTRRVCTGLYSEDQDDRLTEDLARFLRDRGGHFKGQASELHAQLESRFKPPRPDELSKKLKTIADRYPCIGYHSGHEPTMREDGGRTTRRFIELTLRIGVNGVSA